MQKRLMGLTLLVMSLAGCGNNDSARALPDSAPVAAPMTPAVPAASTGASLHGLLTANPAMLAGCQPQAVTVSWDISSLGPQVNDVQVFAGDSLFASGGSTGSSLTGAWTQPGSKFTLKGVPDGAVLDELVVGGPNCPK